MNAIVRMVVDSKVRTIDAHLDALEKAVSESDPKEQILLRLADLREEIAKIKAELLK